MFGVKRKLETAFAELAASLPPATDLAAELMPAFGPDGPQRRGSGEGPSPAPIELAKWLFRGHPKPSFTS